MLVPGVASLVDGETSQSLKSGFLELALHSACSTMFFSVQKGLIYFCLYIHLYSFML